MELRDDEFLVRHPEVPEKLEVAGYHTMADQIEALR